MNREEQLELQRILQAKSQRKAELFEKALNTELIPMGRLSPRWMWKAMRAIRMASPLSQRISLKEFARVLEAATVPKDTTQITTEHEITLFQFGVLCNCIESVSSDDLNCTSTEEYLQIVNETLEHIAYYKERMSKIQEEIEKEVDEEFLMKAATTNNLKAVGSA